MATTIISNTAARLPVATTALMIYGAYECHRIYTGKHARVSPQLETAGISAFSKGNNNNNENSESGGSNRVATTGDAPSVSDTPIRWTNVNGIPIPTLAAFMGTSREE
jgi:hypothetical protein